MHNDRLWATKDELHYIRKVAGRFVLDGLIDQTALDARIKVLQGYLIACDYRHNWGRIDKQAVVLAVHDELARAKALKEKYEQAA